MISAKIVLAVADLTKEYEKKYENESNKRSIYPSWWYDLEDYNIKKDLLEQAINTNSKLTEMKKIQDISQSIAMNRLFQEYEKNRNEEKTIKR